VPHPCPDCDEPLVFAFRDTSGTGAHKRGDAFNTVPDTDHYVCFVCLKAWKQRLDGRLTPDLVGDLAFFACRVEDCGRRLEPAGKQIADAAVERPFELQCAHGHRFELRRSQDGSLVLEAGRSAT
jgi:hypothetical protein